MTIASASQSGPCPVTGEAVCRCDELDLSQLADTDGKLADHQAMVDLLRPDDASHVAVSSGDWSDPSTWEGGRVPGAGADVYIPRDVAVRYDVDSNVEMGIVRVDGGLHFATDVDTKMVLDTLITDFASHLTIGTADQPVQRGVQAEIVIADNGPIDLREDPNQIGRGVVTHGEVEIHGADKAPYLKLAEEPRAGDTTLKLEGDVGSWSVGDSLVVMGTEYVGNDRDGILRTQDEEVTIVAINEATGVVTIDRALRYDHTTPDFDGRNGIDLEPSVYVGNSSRNVTISSENPEGVRGHVMFMHNPDVQVRFAEFHELGRTDKSKPINTNELWDENDWSNRGPGINNGPGENVIGTARNPGTDNVEGRYSLHIHRAGAEEDAQLAILEGNAVTGSPGWGIVHHDSHAAVDFNFVYGVSGAGIVSEDGNETGQWIGNFVTSTVGTDRDPDRNGDANVLTLEKSGDFGIDGVAFESQARQIIQQDNIAANSKTAWMFNTSETSTQGPDIDVIQFDPSGNPFAPVERLDEEDAPIIGFIGNQIAVTGEGIFTGHRNIDNATDIQQTFEGLLAWGVSNEAVHFFNYTNEYVIKDSLFIDVGRAFKVGDKVEGINLSNVHVEDSYAVFEARGYNAEGKFVDVTYDGVRRTLEARDENRNTVDLTREIIDGSTVTPVDQITFTAARDARMTINSGGGDIDIRGQLTDSLGSFAFHANSWIRQPVHTFEGLQASIPGRDIDFILDKYGAIKNGDGSWDLAFYWWVGDRLTGENQAVFIPLELRGFSNSYLQQYRVDGFTPPSNAIELYYTDGIQSIDQEFEAGGGSGGGSGGGAPRPPANTTPVARDDAPFFVTAGETIFIPINGLLSNDGDADGDSLSLVNIGAAFGGSIQRVSVNGEDMIRFIATDDAGNAGFTYTIADGRGGRDSASVSITVEPSSLPSIEEPPANTAPNARNDAAQTAAGQAVAINVLNNDADPDGDSLSIASFSQGDNGSVTRGADGRLVYSPNDGFSGADDFTYQVRDGAGGRSTATVAVTVNAPPPSPVTPPDSGDDEQPGGRVIELIDGARNFTADRKALVIDHDRAFEADEGSIRLTFNAFDADRVQGLFSKDSEGFDDGGHLTLALFRGELVLRAQTDERSLLIEGGQVFAGVDNDVSIDWADGRVTMSLNGQVIGSADGWPGLGGNLEPIVIGASQAKSDDEVANRLKQFFAGEISDVSISVGGDSVPTPAPVNQSPTARNDSVTTMAGSALTIDVLGNDVDPDGDDLSVASFSQPTNGRISRGADGALIYTPDAGFVGTDRFTYRAEDGEGGADVAQVSVKVLAEGGGSPGGNVRPVAGDDGPYRVETKASVDIPVAALLANDADANADNLSIVWIGAASGGRAERLTVGGEDVVRFTAGAEAGEAKFTYVVADGRGGRDDARVTISVDAADVGGGAPDDDAAVSLIDGPRIFNGRSAVVVDHDPIFETDEGAIRLQFRADSVNGVQGLVSKDSSGYDDGGHLTLVIEDGELVLRAQTLNESLTLSGGRIAPGVRYDAHVEWADGGIVLSLNGGVVGEVDGWGGLGPNIEPIVIGASQVRSRDGVASNLESYFSGEISVAEFEAGGGAAPAFAAARAADPLAGIDDVDGLWAATMTGGAADLWADPGAASNAVGASARQGAETWSNFFVINERYAADSAQAHSLTAGTANDQYGLLSEQEDRLVVYAEDTDTVTLNLSGLSGDPGWTGGARIVAVDTDRAYNEIDLGVVDLKNQTINLDRDADWALSIEGI